MTENPVFARIEADIQANDIVLYMKGTPVFPMCGFSAQVVQVLEALQQRRQELDARGDSYGTQDALVQAAEQRLDRADAGLWRRPPIGIPTAWYGGQLQVAAPGLPEQHHGQ